MTDRIDPVALGVALGIALIAWFEKYGTNRAKEKQH